MILNNLFIFFYNQINRKILNFYLIFQIKTEIFYKILINFDYLKKSEKYRYNLNLHDKFCNLIFDN